MSWSSLRIDRPMMRRNDLRVDRAWILYGGGSGQVVAAELWRKKSPAEICELLVENFFT